MRLTKLGHSCVLVEADGQTVLFDPGVWANQQLIEQTEPADTVVYTHEHDDHFNVDILKGLISKNPRLQVVCNREIATLIAEAGIFVAQSDETEDIKKFISPHEALPIAGAQAPAQNGYHFKELFSHPGDSQRFGETKRVLAMPFIGPWGKTGDSIAKMLELKPECVLPIHDWHYTDEAKDWLQGLLETALSPQGIKVLPNHNGQVIEI